MKRENDTGLDIKFEMKSNPINLQFNGYKIQKTYPISTFSAFEQIKSNRIED